MTANGEIAKTIGAALGVPLKAAGFRKRANSFNRTTADGLVHHLSVQLGSFDPSGIHAVPGLIPDLYGRFTVNLGVHVPAMSRMGNPRSSWINDYNCQLRWRLGNLLPGGFDQWWDLRDRVALDEVLAAVENVGLPTLDPFPNAESVLDTYEREGPAGFGSIASAAVALDVADLLLARRETERARALLERYVDEISQGRHRPHQEYVREYLAERGLSDLDAPLR